MPSLFKVVWGKASSASPHPSRTLFVLIRSLFTGIYAICPACLSPLLRDIHIEAWRGSLLFVFFRRLLILNQSTLTEKRRLSGQRPCTLHKKELFVVALLVLTFVHPWFWAGTKPALEMRHFLSAGFAEQLGVCTVNGPKAKCNYSIQQGQLKRDWECVCEEGRMKPKVTWETLMVGLRRSGFSSMSSLSELFSLFSRKHKGKTKETRLIKQICLSCFFPSLTWNRDWGSGLILLGCTNLSWSFALNILLNNPAVKGYAMPIEPLPANQSSCLLLCCWDTFPKEELVFFSFSVLYRLIKWGAFWNVYDELITQLVVVHNIHQGWKGLGFDFFFFLLIAGFAANCPGSRCVA